MRPSTSITSRPVGVVGVGIGGDRLRQRDVDLAEWFARIDLFSTLDNSPGIDRPSRSGTTVARTSACEPDQDLLAFDKRFSCSQKIGRAAAGVARLVPTWAMTSPRSMNSSRSSVTPTDRPASGRR